MRRDFFPPARQLPAPSRSWDCREDAETGAECAPVRHHPASSSQCRPQLRKYASLALPSLSWVFAASVEGGGVAALADAMRSLCDKVIAVEARACAGDDHVAAGANIWHAHGGCRAGHHIAKAIGQDVAGAGQSLPVSEYRLADHLVLMGIAGVQQVFQILI